jgi:hypothetical protein
MVEKFASKEPAWAGGCRLQSEDGGDTFLQNVDLHGATSQKTAFLLCLGVSFHAQYNCNFYQKDFSACLIYSNPLKASLKWSRFEPDCSSKEGFTEHLYAAWYLSLWLFHILFTDYYEIVSCGCFAHVCRELPRTVLACNCIRSCLLYAQISAVFVASLCYCVGETYLVWKNYANVHYCQFPCYDTLFAPVYWVMWHNPEAHKWIFNALETTNFI